MPKKARQKTQQQRRAAKGDFGRALLHRRLYEHQLQQQQNWGLSAAAAAADVGEEEFDYKEEKSLSREERCHAATAAGGNPGGAAVSGNVGVAAKGMVFAKSSHLLSFFRGHAGPQRSTAAAAAQLQSITVQNPIENFITTVLAEKQLREQPLRAHHLADVSSYTVSSDSLADSLLPAKGSKTVEAAEAALSCARQEDLEVPLPRRPRRVHISWFAGYDEVSTSPTNAAQAVMASTSAGESNADQNNDSSGERKASKYALRKQRLQARRRNRHSVKLLLSGRFAESATLHNLSQVRQQQQQQRIKWDKQRKQARELCRKKKCASVRWKGGLQRSAPACASIDTNYDARYGSSEEEEDEEEDEPNADLSSPQLGPATNATETKAAAAVSSLCRAVGIEDKKTFSAERCVATLASTHNSECAFRRTSLSSSKSRHRSSDSSSCYSNSSQSRCTSQNLGSSHARSDSVRSRSSSLSGCDGCFTKSPRSSVIINGNTSFEETLRLHDHDATETLFADGASAVATTDALAAAVVGHDTAASWQEREVAAYAEWRRQVARLEEMAIANGSSLTPYERNFEVWRELWRAVERSHLVLQVVDGRDIRFFRTTDLDQMVKELDSRKEVVLLINKADLMPAAVRSMWAEALAAENISYIFFSALRELKQQQLLHEQQQPQQEDQRADKSAEHCMPHRVYMKSLISPTTLATQDQQLVLQAMQERLDDSPECEGAERGVSVCKEQRKSDRSLLAQNLVSDSAAERSQFELKPHNENNTLNATAFDTAISSGCSPAEAAVSFEYLGRDNLIWGREQLLEFLLRRREAFVASFREQLQRQLLRRQCKGKGKSRRLIVEKSSRDAAAERASIEESVSPPEFVVGLVGYPNVGKSSVINAILGCKRVGISKRPGKTKHVQTLPIANSGVTLCDCPGLVFPRLVATKHHLTIHGVLPLECMGSNYIPSIQLICDTFTPQVLLERYGLQALFIKSGYPQPQRQMDSKKRQQPFLHAGNLASLENVDNCKAQPAQQILTACRDDQVGGLTRKQFKQQVHDTMEVSEAQCVTRSLRAWEFLESLAIQRKFTVGGRGGQFDLYRAALMVLRDFVSGNLAACRGPDGMAYTYAPCTRRGSCLLLKNRGALEACPVSAAGTAVDHLLPAKKSEGDFHEQGERGLRGEKDNEGELHDSGPESQKRYFYMEKGFSAEDKNNEMWTETCKEGVERYNDTRSPQTGVNSRKTLAVSGYVHRINEFASEDSRIIEADYDSIGLSQLLPSPAKLPDALLQEARILGNSHAEKDETTWRAMLEITEDSDLAHVANMNKRGDSGLLHAVNAAQKQVYTKRKLRFMQKQFAKGKALAAGQKRN